MKQHSRLLWKVPTFAAISGALIFRHQLASLLALPSPIADLLLFIVGGILTAFLTVLGGHVATTDATCRRLFYICGSVLSAVIVITGFRNYSSVMKAKTPEEIVIEAVEEANLHSDDQAAKLKNELRAATGAIKETVAERTSGLVDELRPRPAELAMLQFSSYVQRDTDFPLLFRPIRVNQDGSYTVNFNAKNMSNVTAKAVEIWVQICNPCRYARDPEGFDRPTGSDEHVRHISFGDLHARIATSRMSIEVNVPMATKTFDTGFNYACGNCETGKPWEQIITSYVLP